MSDSRSLAEIRSLIVSGLRQRRPEIEQAICARIDTSVPHPASREDPDYEAGLQEAVTSIVGYSLNAIEKGSEWSEPIPSAAGAQARRAARVGVNLGIIQRRYFVGHREFGEFVTRQIECAGLLNNGEVVHHLRRTQEALLERLAAASEQEYNQEQESIGRSRLSETVQRLLSGESVAPDQLTEFDYEIDNCWHIGLMASGSAVDDITRTLRARYGRKFLCVLHNSHMCAWLGMAEVPTDNQHLTLAGHPELPVSVGEPGFGRDGWRLTHDQARAAFAVALRRPKRVAWYADSRLLAAALQNKTLARSLTQKYLVPLREQGDQGAKLHRTLRTYIDAECNATSAAHGLAVGRHTVENRVHTAERLIGATLRECLPELDVALQLEELNHASDASAESVSSNGLPC